MLKPVGAGVGEQSPLERCPAARQAPSL